MSEGFPIVRRFVIKRHPITFSTKFPWVVRDRTRPAFLGHHATFEAAIAAVDKKLAEETGIPTRREIREAMGRHVNAPCSVVPTLPNHCSECGAWGTVEVHLSTCSRRADGYALIEPTA